MRDEAADEPLDDCPGPHAECQGCGGTALVQSMALYVSSGRGHSVVRMQGCRHCAGRGYTCRSGTRCHLPPTAPGE